MIRIEFVELCGDHDDELAVGYDLDQLAAAPESRESGCAVRGDRPPQIAVSELIDVVRRGCGDPRLRDDLLSIRRPTPGEVREAEGPEILWAEFQKRAADVEALRVYRPCEVGVVEGFEARCDRLNRPKSKYDLGRRLGRDSPEVRREYSRAKSRMDRPVASR